MNTPELILFIVGFALIAAGYVAWRHTLKQQERNEAIERRYFS